MTEVGPRLPGPLSAVPGPLSASRLGPPVADDVVDQPPAAAEGPAAGAVAVRDRLHPAEVAVLAVALVVGLVQRWQVVHGPLGYTDLDEATAGIAAREFFSHPSVFFPAQPYGGTPESALVGLVHAVFGSGQLQLKAVPMLLHLVACVLVWDAAKRVVPSRAGQLAAPILLWLGPAAGVWESTKERGFYGAAIVAAAALLAVAARLDRTHSARGVVAFGATVGLGWWISPLLILVAAPVTVWLLVRDPLRLDNWRLAVPAAVVGASPWLAWNVANGFESLRQPPSLGTDIFTRFGAGLSKVAVLVGLETPWDHQRTLVPGARTVAVVGVLAAAVVAFGRKRATGASLSGAVVVGYLFLYPFANNTGTVGADPRYLYPLLPALALAVANLLPVGAPGSEPAADPERGGSDGSGAGGEVPRPAKGEGSVVLRSVALAVLVGALVTGLTAWGLAGLDEASSDDVRFLDAPGTTEMIRTLEERHVTFAITDLAGAQITYATEGRIKASSFAVPRFPELERLALVEQPSTYVLDDELGGNASRLELWLARRHIPYERVRHGVWTILFIDRWVPPWEADVFTLQGRVVKPEPR